MRLNGGRLRVVWLGGPLIVALAALLVVPSALAGPVEFERVWGMGVDGDTPGAGAEVCVVATHCANGTEGALGGEFSFPPNVTSDAAGFTYVSDAVLNRIQKFDPNGNFVLAFGKDVVSGGGTGFEVCTFAASCKSGVAGTLGGELSNPGDLATDAAGNLYVIDSNNNRVQEFSPSGSFLRAWGKDVVTGGGTGAEVCTTASACKVGGFGALGGEFWFAFGGIAVDGAGSVYVVDAHAYEFSNERIQKFDAAGNFLRAWGKDVVTGGGTGFEICTAPATCKAGASGTQGGELGFPTGGLAADASGTVYVGDRGNERIQRFDSSGNFLGAWGKDVDVGGGAGAELCTVPSSCKAGVRGTLGGEFANIQGVAAGPDGTVYVGEMDNFRVQEFSASGGFLRTWGIDADRGGNLRDFETCTVATRCKAGVISTTEQGDQLRPTDVSVDPAGEVFVANWLERRVQKFHPAVTIDRLTGRRLTVSVPGPGEIVLRDARGGKAKRIKPASATATTAGPVGVKLKLTRAAKRKLKRAERIKVNASVTFTPAAGTPDTVVKKLTVKK